MGRVLLGAQFHILEQAMPVALLVGRPGQLCLGAYACGRSLGTADLYEAPTAVSLGGAWVF
eukprot:12916367-Prorocentrum_lima.AAC.1